jgi:hypothetical protein
MALVTRTAPPKSFGRRPVPQAQQAPAPVPAKNALRQASDVPAEAGQSLEKVPPPILLADDKPQDTPKPTLLSLIVVRQSVAVIRKNPLTFLALFVAIALPEQFLAYLPISLGLPAGLVQPLFATLGCMALYAATFHGALASVSGEKVNFDTCLLAITCAPLRAYGIIAVTVSSLSLMLILPVAGLAGSWALAAPVAIVEGRDARARSMALTVPCRAQVRLLVLLLAGLTLLCGLLTAGLATGSVVEALTTDWLCPMLLTLLAAVMGAVLYRKLVPLAA